MESCSFAPILAAHFPFWGELSSEDRETLCRSTAQVRFAGGTTLHDGSRFSDVMWVMQQILFMSMDRRLAIFLLDEAAKTGDNRIRLTHEQIARYMGSAREVVSRMLRYFAAEGLVVVGRGGVTLLDRARLRAMAG